MIDISYFTLSFVV